MCAKPNTLRKYWPRNVNQSFYSNKTFSHLPFHKASTTNDNNKKAPIVCHGSTDIFLTFNEKVFHRDRFSVANKSEAQTEMEQSSRKL